MHVKHSAILTFLGLAATCGMLRADPIIYESFTGYLDNALISASPAGPAIGLTGDWSLDPDNFFYVNRSEADLDAGSGMAVYDMPYDDNGARTAQRQAVSGPALFQAQGDVFYASFRARPPRADGNMLFTLTLDRLDGGGQPDLSFGMKGGDFIIGNGGVNADVVGGIPLAAEMQIVMRVVYGDGNSGQGNQETVTLWVNPVEETSSPVIDEVLVDLVNPGGATISGIAIRGDQMDGQPAFFDDLLVGYAFEDVSSPPSGILTNPLGLNGLFYDPSESGHGFNFVVHRFGLTIYYYGHTGNGERLWLISESYSADIQYNQPFTLEMFQVLDGTFGQPQDTVTPWGSILFEMADCDTGHASFDGLDGILEMDFVRLTSMPGMSCQ
jgi:hypothetical protein